MTVLLDTHALYWLDTRPERLGRRASAAIRGSSELAVAGVTWYEMARLAELGRIQVPLPVVAWLDELAREVRSVSITPAIAATAAALGRTFSGDPVDRIIYATAIERGWQLATKDRRMLDYPADRRVAIW